MGRETAPAPRPRRRDAHCGTVLLALGLLLSFPSAPRADPLKAPLRSDIHTDRAPVAVPTLPDHWWRDHFALHLKGVEYRDEFTFAERGIRLRVSGPFVRRSPGLRLELHGELWHGIDATFTSYGSLKRQGIKLEFAF